MQWLWTCALLVALIDTGNGLARNNLGKYSTNNSFSFYYLTGVVFFNIYHFCSLLRVEQHVLVMRQSSRGS